MISHQLWYSLPGQIPTHKWGSDSHPVPKLRETLPAPGDMSAVAFSWFWYRQEILAGSMMPNPPRLRLEVLRDTVETERSLFRVQFRSRFFFRSQTNRSSKPIALPRQNVCRQAIDLRWTWVLAANNSSHEGLTTHIVITSWIWACHWRNALLPNRMGCSIGGYDSIFLPHSAMKSSNLATVYLGLLFQFGISAYTQYLWCQCPVRYFFSYYSICTEANKVVDFFVHIWR